MGGGEMKRADKLKSNVQLTNEEQEYYLQRFKTKQYSCKGETPQRERHGWKAQEDERKFKLLKVTKDMRCKG